MNGKHGWAPKALILGLLALLTTVEAVWGDEEEEQKPFSTVSFTFDFTPPGARSLGMGGAFLGLADDATAAYTNPAGLTNLAVGGPEVAMEIQSRDVKELNATGGHAFGEPSHLGLDTRTEPFLQESKGQTTGLSFLSVGYVLPGGTSLALYRHELLSFRMRSESQGLFLGSSPDSPLCVNLRSCWDRTFAFQTVQEAQVVNFGLSGAYEVQVPFTRWQDSLSLGMGVSLYQLDLLARADHYSGTPGAGVLGPDGLFGPNQFLGGNYQYSDAEVGDDTDVRFSLGFLWKIGEKERWRLGGVYRQGPRFSTRILTLFESQELEAEPGSFTVPDSYGLGVAYSANEGRTKVAFDYNRIRYSQRSEELARPAEDNFANIGFTGVAFEIEDSDQVHLGFEQIFPILEPALIGTVRLGAWREPHHDLAYVGNDPDVKDLFARGPRKAQNHFAVGFGVIFKENVQLDLAADFSDLRDVVSVSFVKFL